MKKLTIIILLASALWSQTTFYNTYGDRIERHKNIGYSIINTKDSCIAICGDLGRYYEFGHPANYYGNAFIIKTDTTGKLKFCKAYGDSLTRQYAFDFGQNKEGGFVLPTYDMNFGKLWVVYTNYYGDTLWTKYYDSLGVVSSIENVEDDKYVMTGTSGSNPEKAFLLKIDSMGNTEWKKYYNKSSSANGQYVKQVNDGGFLIAATTRLPEPKENDIWVIRTTTDGDTLWTMTYGDNYSDTPYSIEEVGHNEYIVVGTSLSLVYGGLKTNISLTKINSNGAILWHKVIESNLDDIAFASDQTNDGNIILAGRSVVLSDSGRFLEEILLMKIDYNGNTLWSKTLSSEDFSDEFVSGDIDMWAHDIVISHDNSIIITGYIENDFSKITDIVLIKLNDDGELTSISIVNKDDISYELLKNYPNPLNPTTTIEYEIPEAQNIKLQVFDITGRLIETLYNGYREAGHWKLIWDASEQSSGIYIYRLTYGDKQVSRKMLVLK